jgi:hypothetical protein
VEGVYYSLLLYQLKKKGDKTDHNNYHGISLLSTSYKMLSNILLSRFSPYIDVIIGNHQCGVSHNRSTTDQIFCIHQIWEKKWKYNETVHQLFIDFKKAYSSVRRAVLYSILIDFGVPMKLVRLIKISTNICRNLLTQQMPVLVLLCTSYTTCFGPYWWPSSVI